MKIYFDDWNGEKGLYLETKYSIYAIFKWGKYNESDI